MRHQASSLFLSMLLLACNGDEKPVPTPNDVSTAPTMPSAAWSTEPLSGAINVREAREQRKDGDEVVLRGTLQDFGELATFKLVEDSLRDCNEMGDECATPWDFCCTSPETLAELTVNVEFLEGDLPASWSLRGTHGLDHLTEVAVAGRLRFDVQKNMRLEAVRMSLQ